ncbi:DUF7453 family protein [Wenzhouxiangella sp. EGI_FJ10409]|uniref:DUF7453 family protein n=1 Tax=Wenzhouxiangella sp. EGI_FJ10409 TaxID=3243767 RepID=UPI0035D68FC0
MRIVVHGAACLAALILWAPSSAAELDDAQLLMRSGPTSSLNIPVGSSWNSATPTLNDEQQVALHIGAVAPAFRAGIWSGDPDGGGIVAESPDDSSLYSDADINADGDIVWRRAESSQNGVMRYDAATGTFDFYTNAPLGSNSWGSVQINDSGGVAYRAGFGSGNAWVSYADDAATVHLADSSADGTSDYDWLFTPSFNDQGLIAGKVAYQGLSTNQVVIADASGNVSVLLEDNNLDTESPFSNFNNGIDFNGVGQVAVVASLAEGGAAVIVADESGWTEYARQDTGELGEIEYFAPQINDAGVVVFRAFDSTGERGIWMADGENLTLVARHGDIVTTDLGPARLESPDEVGGPNFGGAPAVNGNGDIAFVSLLTDPDDSATSYGRGVFLVAGQTELPDPIFSDRFEAAP